jgi:hypothetical protein
MERMRSVVAEGFSLISGGPFHALMQKIGLIRPGSLGVAQRCVSMLALVWFPLVLITAVQGSLVGDAPTVPFLMDFAVNIRLLVAMPLLILAERVIEPRVKGAAIYFLESGLVRQGDLPAFEEAIRETARETNSTVVESLCIAVIVALAFTGLRMEMSVAQNTWQGAVFSTGIERTAAGWWHAVVSLPVYQFLVLRWAWRLFIWGRFLWRMSRLDLNLVPTHPDAAAGLGFLNITQAHFAILGLSLSCVAAGNFASRIVFGGGSFAHYEVFAVGLVLINSCIILVPLVVFIPKLIAVKRKGLREYGALANRYVNDFDEKWLRREDTGEELLGSGDIQSLADLANSYGVIRGLRIVLIDLTSVKAVVMASALPLVPLYLSQFDVKQLVGRLIGLIL